MNREQEYFDALKRIASYESSEKLIRTAEKRYGLTPAETLEYAHDNMLAIAKDAIKGKRRPAK